MLCEKTVPPAATQRSSIRMNGTSSWPRDEAYFSCPMGHYTKLFLACDVRSSCWARDYSTPCKLPRAMLPPSFNCSDHSVRVPYTMVCDHHADCIDGSDENFCVFPPCRSREFSCGDTQCIPAAKACNGWDDCRNGGDEDVCTMKTPILAVVPPPALVSLSSGGYIMLSPFNSTPAVQQPEGACQDSHFECQGNSYCLPMVLRCNGVYDCPSREDEAGCDKCPGFYRCRASPVCLHRGDLCDGRSHCPQHDDELLCDLICPPSCVCLGLAFFCRRNFSASGYPGLRFLDGSDSGMTPEDLTANRYLIHLSLANCGLGHLQELFLPNLLSLDVNDNQLSAVWHEHLLGAPQLRELSLAGNPLTLAFENAKELRAFSTILKLDLSRVVIRVLNVTALHKLFPNLRNLNLSYSGVQVIQGEGFHIMDKLRMVDMRGCPIKRLPRFMFQGLHHLQRVHADSFKICCPAVLPKGFALRNCFAPSDEISSCDNLLFGRLYSIFVFVLSITALVGNATSFIFRTFVLKHGNKLGYGKFVTHLSVSDFLIGVYLAFIGIANQVYQGIYLWNEMAWRSSVACQFAGFLSLVSSEVSALIMCLITIDRFLVLRFPFSRMHFKSGSAHAASAFVWVAGVLLASIPLLPMTSHWEFYSQTSICIPLPITRTNFAGRNYSFGIYIVFNFVLFVFISIGQLSIYWTVRVNSMPVARSTKKTKDLTAARRLFSVAMTDFLCWFPIGVLGLLASTGFPVPGEVNVVVAIFVLPLNSAINPCLYTLNIILERRNRARGEKLRAFLLAQLKTQK